ncbi:MAG: D-alanyl-D-alanine carboxypeptidase family protein [Deltaproteobacteria bacterium]|nr:D-alanyl-D-alanine carboxypeptidase family protein [Deltaproteobacteria bacterium]
MDVVNYSALITHVCHIIGNKVDEWQCPSCSNGQTISCYSGASETKGVGECRAGTQTCTNGQWGACQGEVLPTEEICDGLDNNCNGLVDDISPICYTGPAGTQGIGICKTGTHVCENGILSACIGVVTPQEEVCDGLDNNCDGTTDEGCTTCAVSPLTPLTDPLAIRMENGETVIYDGLTTAMQQSVDCFSDTVFNAGGTLNITSAYRPLQYQQHLREVWDKYDLLENTSDPACDELKSEVREEFQRHRLRYRPARTSRHTAGTAIDASWNLPAGQSIDALANRCVLSRPVANDCPARLFRNNYFEFKVSPTRFSSL